MDTPLSHGRKPAATVPYHSGTSSQLWLTFLHTLPQERLLPFLAFQTLNPCNEFRHDSKKEPPSCCLKSQGSSLPHPWNSSPINLTTHSQFSHCSRVCRKIHCFVSPLILLPQHFLPLLLYPVPEGLKQNTSLTFKKHHMLSTAKTYKQRASTCSNSSNALQVNHLSLIGNAIQYHSILQYLKHLQYILYTPAASQLPKELIVAPLLK